MEEEVDKEKEEGEGYNFFFLKIVKQKYVQNILKILICSLFN